MSLRSASHHSPYVNLMSKPNHVYSTAASAGLSPDMNQPSPPAMPLAQTRAESFLRSRRPTLPKIDSSLAFSSPLLDELTSGSSTVLSPVSTKSATVRTPRGTSAFATSAAAEKGIQCKLEAAPQIIREATICRQKQTKVHLNQGRRGSDAAYISWKYPAKIAPSQPPVASANVLYDEPQSIDIALADQTQNETVHKASAAFPLQRPRKDSVPSYKSKQPPPIDSTAFVPKPTPLRSATMPDLSPKLDVSMDASNSLGQRRSQSASAITRDWLEIYLDEEPSPTPPLSFTSSPPETSHQTPILPIPMADKGTPAILLSSAFAASSRRDSNHLGTMDFAQEGRAAPVATEPLLTDKEESKVLHFGSEWTEALFTLTSNPETSGSIARRPSDIQFNRHSVDSASSYGSFDGQTASSSSSLPAPDESDLLPVEPAQLAVEVPLGLQPRRNCDSPTDPLFVDGRLSPMPSDSPKRGEAATLASTVPSTRPSETAAKQQTQARRPARKDSLALSNQKKPFAGSKGICRGCSRPILAGEKSVVSGDGRLTGRYHKECMVCSTCKSPFLTAEFYVHADRPYCAHHYHELENSLCATCGRGIEGLYAETANVAGRGREKHHAKCLKCAQCCVQLTEDYFELSGKVYCERDAFRIASAMWTQQGNSKAPARSSPLVREYICSSGEPTTMQKGDNFPQRMITKVMTAT
ncbi:hypothetical protein DV735_g2945, partial [Chaetothyriales sp. CBS 134920]